MRKRIVLLYSCFYFCLGSGVWAQVPQDTPLTDASQWQLTFDVIKSRVQTLLEQNNQLTSEFKSLQSQAEDLQKKINELSSTNESIQGFLKERNGRTDQHLRMEELNGQLKQLKAQLSVRQKQVDEIKKEALDWRRKVDLKKLRISDLELHQNAVIPVVKTQSSSGDVELDDLRKDLADQKAQEVDLENQINALRNHKEISTKDAQVKQVDNTALEQRLELLRQQKAILTQKKSIESTTKVEDGRYYAMSHQKMELETRIRDFENRMNALKDPAVLGLSSQTQRKKIIHDIVQADARNGQLREKVANLREDIGILKDQIARLEKKVNFSQGKWKSK